MQENKTYENFPFWIPLLAWSLSISIYVIGSYILGVLFFPLAIGFIFYCLWIEIRILKGSCMNCYYYGKHCGIGRGKLCSVFFKKGDPINLCTSSWPRSPLSKFKIPMGTFLTSKVAAKEKTNN